MDSRTRDPLDLIVASTWDGLPIDESEVSTLSLQAAEGGWRLTVDAPFHGDPPPTSPPGTLDGLWRYEVVELFVAGPGERYLEIELGPHEHHLVLQLAGIRQRSGPPSPLGYHAHIEGDRWRGEAFLPVGLVPRGPYRVNAYAQHGSNPRRYLAHASVPGESPDFHRLDRFVSVVLPNVS